MCFLKVLVRPKAFVTKIISRARTKFVGTLSINGNTSFVIPDNSKIHTDFYIPKERLNGAKDGDKVLIKYRDWPATAKNPYASVVEVFGKSGENKAEMHS